MTDTTAPQVPILAVDMQGLSTVLSVPLDDLRAMVHARSWLTGHLPVPVEVGATGRPVRRLWPLAEVERWLQPDRIQTDPLEPRLVDYRGLAALLSYSPSKVRRLVAEAASTGWDDLLLPRPLSLPGQRMWSVAAVDQWLDDRIKEVQSW